MALVGDPISPNPKRQKTEPKIIESPCLDCNHRCVYNGICIFCNSKVDKTKTRSFDYLDKGLAMSHEAVLFAKQDISQTSWLEEKKLHLVLDLDHTLLHSVSVSKLSESGKCLTEEADSRKDLGRFRTGKRDELLIKLRPFVHQFLKEANEMFSMFVYTNGTYEYARYVVELIDPDKCYFGERIITRRESPGVKTLDLVLADERGVVIVDDMRSVWPRHKRNLLQISQYRYFRASNGFYSASVDESEENGKLAKILNFLKQVHRGFFDVCSEDKLDSVDVRPLLRDFSRPKRKIISETRKVRCEDKLTNEAVLRAINLALRLGNTD